MTTSARTAHTLAGARDALVSALADYQKATMEISLALSHVTQHTHSLYQSLSNVVEATTPMLTPRR